MTLGLGSLPVDEKNKLLQHIYERLEMNVGMRLAEKMTDQQLEEFESFIDRNDEGGALRWLETNFPNYKQVVAEELEKLKSEVAQAAPQILAAAGAAAQGQLGQPQSPPQPRPMSPPGPAYQQPNQQPFQPPQPQFNAPQPQYAQPQQPQMPPSFQPGFGPQQQPSFQPPQPQGPQPGFSPNPQSPGQPPAGYPPAQQG